MKSEISRTVTFKLAEEERLTLNDVAICEVRVRIDDQSEDNPEEDYVEVEFCGWPVNKDGTKRKSARWRKIWPGVEQHNKWEALARKELGEQLD